MSTQTTINMPTKSLSIGRQPESSRGDRIGVVLSVLCAIHCAVTPFLLLGAPAFGKIWSHPASHWLVALFVVPLAVFMVSRGYRRHRRKWIIASGAIGILLVLAGAAAPSFGQGEAGASGVSSPHQSEDSASETDCEECPDSECHTECEDSETGCEHSGTEGETECEHGNHEVADQADAESSESVSEAQDEACVDACCPSLQAGEDGGWRVHIPLASILTTLGGLLLIVTHIGNLCGCPSCQSEQVLS